MMIHIFILRKTTVRTFTAYGTAVHGLQGQVEEDSRLQHEERYVLLRAFT